MAEKEVKQSRYKLLRHFESLFEIPMILLGFIWIGLLLYELIFKVTPFTEKASFTIWIIFIVDFIIKLLLAPFKIKFLRTNTLTMISLVVPAFRVLRVLRVFRIARGLRLVKILGSINRGMRALNATMKRRAFGFVMALTLLVLFIGAAGMYAFEKDVNGGLGNFGTALWWTGMVLTTMGSEAWPKTVEGRILCLVLAIYSFTVFGYITASIASFFIGRDAESKESEIAGAQQIEELKREIRELKELIKK